LTRSKRSKDVPHFKKLQEAAGSGKTRISIMLDDAVIASFRARTVADGASYQTEFNRALRKACKATSQ